MNRPLGFTPEAYRFLPGQPTRSFPVPTHKILRHCLVTKSAVYFADMYFTSATRATVAIVIAQSRAALKPELLVFSEEIENMQNHKKARRRRRGPPSSILKKGTRVIPPKKTPPKVKQTQTRHLLLPLHFQSIMARKSGLPERVSQKKL